MPRKSVEVVELQVDYQDERLTRVVLRHPDFPDHVFTLEFNPDGELGSFGVRATSTTVTRRLLRDVPLGGLEAAARANFARLDPVIPLAPENVHPRARSLFDEMKRRRAVMSRRPGRRGTPDYHYAVLAGAYVELVAAGSTRPNAELAKTLRGGNAQTVTNQLSEARRRKLLTSAPRGRAGGALTGKAIEILKQGEA